MADVNIVIAAQDMATGVMKSIAVQTKAMGQSFKSASAVVVNSTQAMSTGLTSLYATMGPLLAIILSMQAAVAVFRFLSDSVSKFIEAGSPAGVELGKSFEVAAVALNQFQQVVGAILAPLIKAAAEIFMVLVQVIGQSLTPAIGGMQDTFEALAPYIEAFKIGMIAAITGIEVAITNFGAIWSMITQSIELRTVQTSLAIGTFFLETGPQAIYDFAMLVGNTIPKVPKIIYDSFVTIFNTIQSVMIGLKDKVVEVFQAIWEFIRSGGKSAIDTSITDFAGEAAKQIQAVQSEAARQVGSLALGQGLATNLLDGLKSRESELKSGIADSANQLATDFNSKFQQRLSALQAPALPEMKEEAKAEKTTEKLTGGLTKVADSQAAIAQQLSATESRLLTRGPSEGPMQSVAQASQKTAVAAEKTSQSSDRMVELLEQLLARNFIVAEAV